MRVTDIAVFTEDKLSQEEMADAGKFGIRARPDSRICAEVAPPVRLGFSAG
jgi:hypothetical protein